MKSKKKKYCYVLRRANSGTFPVTTDIIGITMSEEYAKKQMSVFCYYEKAEIFYENKK